MMLTLFADASFCPKTGAAGWGSWAIRDGWPKGKFLGGVFRREITTSNTAELCGIASALWQHNKDGDLEGVKTLMLQCDNIVALGCIMRHVRGAYVKNLPGKKNVFIHPAPKMNGKLNMEAVEAIKTIVDGRSVMLRHIKGHNGTGDGRSWVNSQCDAEARRHMQARRKELEAAV